VYVVRQHDPGVDAKWQQLAHITHRSAQRVNMRYEQAGPPVARVHREEISRAGNPVASVIRHGI
jgi:hypothetical protein